MDHSQDEFFDRVYWAPSLLSAQNAHLSTGLSTAVAYDSRIHGSWDLVRNKTNAAFGDVEKLGEQAWVSRYVETRRDWLATHANELLHKTVYGLLTEA
jgi:chitosanase